MSPQNPQQLSMAIEASLMKEALLKLVATVEMLRVGPKNWEGDWVLCPELRRRSSLRRIGCCFYWPDLPSSTERDDPSLQRSLGQRIFDYEMLGGHKTSQRLQLSETLQALESAF